MTELCWWLAHTKAINVLIQAMAVPSLLPSSFKEMLKKNKLFFGDIFLQVYHVIQVNKYIQGLTDRRDNSDISY